jgi:predicted GNAT family acetyltransferase
MSATASTLTVRKAEDRSRYELLDGDDIVGIADYRVDGELVVFPHTVITPERRGEGLGEILVQAAMDDVRAEGRKVVPACWFVAEFLGNNPRYTDLAA